ncbi:hypothetical protein D9757_008832 [Collybiopsis confluens]|uniref:Uncharacterized protein n=1 Tax=Collybiopsis confluens TaxID=2823264 RepID=A0A8H5M0D0_9AGAR|nr:hypothetical protein D9757_008832 [Collybiopsis confluens]
MGMGVMFFINSAISIKTHRHPPPAVNSTSAVTKIAPASQAMAGMLYIYVCFYSMGWGYLKFFLMSATLNIGAMSIFSIVIPESKGRSLEEMDIIFGSISQEQRTADVERYEHARNARDVGLTQSHDMSDVKVYNGIAGLEQIGAGCSLGSEKKARKTVGRVTAKKHVGISMEAHVPIWQLLLNTEKLLSPQRRTYNFFPDS